MSIVRTVTAGALALGLGVAPAFAMPSSGAAPDRSERASSVYTDALNGFMAHGWHAVSGMRERNGMVVATGVNGRDQVSGIIWDPGSDTVKRAS